MSSAIISGLLRAQYWRPLGFINLKRGRLVLESYQLRHYPPSSLGDYLAELGDIEHTSQAHKQNRSDNS